ncbi:MAG: histidine--tRNA ligase [Candidatus Sericytochromatia bacterium]
MRELIQPKVLKGFRDYLPELMIQRKKLIKKIENTVESFGFAPIDTPALEYTEILMGKGGEESDKQSYRFNDNGGRDVTLRFDLTVPLARFVAQHYNELGMPFKAYHIAPVWRGENTHKGRYREFCQCDFDILGSNSVLADIEIATMIYNTVHNLLNNDKFTIRINNRAILNGLMNKLSLTDKTTQVLRVIDKIYKETEDKIINELKEKVLINDEQINQILGFVRLKGDNQTILDKLDSMFSDNEISLNGINILKEIISSFKLQGIPEKCIKIDLSIARGLDYYTGSVFETMLDDLPSLGSICSGGRYDNLAGLYTTHQISGIGASVGLDRLISGLEELNMLDKELSPAKVMIVAMDKNYTNDYIQMANELRKSGINTELYSDNKKLDKQMKYADRKGFNIVIINGSQEFEQNKVKIKNMLTGESLANIDRGDLVKQVQSILNQ